MLLDQNFLARIARLGTRASVKVGRIRRRPDGTKDWRKVSSDRDCATQYQLQQLSLPLRICLAHDLRQAVAGGCAGDIKRVGGFLQAVAGQKFTE
jgi:hypothetical protein